MAPAAVVACIQIICALGKRNAMYALSASASRPEPTPYGTAKNSSSQYDGVNEKPSNATTVHATPTSTLRPEPQRRSQGSPASAAHMAPAAITTGIPMTAPTPSACHRPLIQTSSARITCCIYLPIQCIHGHRKAHRRRIWHGIACYEHVRRPCRRVAMRAATRASPP